MNITLNKTDSVNAIITVEVQKADYVNEVEKSLKDLRRNAEMPGFRKGMVPISFIRQRYGSSVLVEEVNKLLSKSVTDYIKDNNLSVLGEPLPVEKQPPFDFETQETVFFSFNIGLAPTVEDITLTKEDTIPYYLVQITDKMIDSHIENLKSQYGVYSHEIESVSGDVLKGHLIELNEDGEARVGGINNESAVFMPAYMKDENEKAKCLNVKLCDMILFNPYTAYEGNEVELASFFNVSKENVKNHTGEFSFEVTEITRFNDAELNQELFDKVYGQGVVNSKEMFREKIKENFAQQFAPESDYQFLTDVRKLLDEKTSDMQFPDTFLKRWLLVSDSTRTPDSLKDQYSRIRSDLKFHLIKEYLIEKYDITIDETEVEDYARQVARIRFAQYGIQNITDDFIEESVKRMMEKPESYHSMGDKVFENKLIEVLKEKVTLDTKELSLEDFQKLYS